MKNGEYWDVSWNPIDEKALLEPLQMEEDKRVFIEKDLFHPSVKDEWRHEIFSIIAQCPRHTFIVVTKWVKEMQLFMDNPENVRRIRTKAGLTSEVSNETIMYSDDRPLRNLHLYAQVENQDQANERIPELLQTPAVVRGVLIEPMLGEVDLWGWLEPTDCCGSGDRYCGCRRDYPQDENMEPIALNSVILGGGTDPLHPEWVSEIRDQCDSAGVSFFFVGWGPWIPDYQRSYRLMMGKHPWGLVHKSGQFRLGKGFPTWEEGEEGTTKVGSRKAGRLLDGTEHNELPEVG